LDDIGHLRFVGGCLDRLLLLVGGGLGLLADRDRIGVSLRCGEPVTDRREQAVEQSASERDQPRHPLISLAMSGNAGELNHTARPRHFVIYATFLKLRKGFRFRNI
jgi:hypothetical protein